jgi:hypothetical protein
VVSTAVQLAIEPHARIFCAFGERTARNPVILSDDRNGGIGGIPIGSHSAPLIENSSVVPNTVHAVIQLLATVFCACVVETLGVGVSFL